MSGAIPPIELQSKGWSSSRPQQIAQVERVDATLSRRLLRQCSSKQVYDNSADLETGNRWYGRRRVMEFFVHHQSEAPREPTPRSFPPMWDRGLTCITSSSMPSAQRILGAYCALRPWGQSSLHGSRRLRLKNVDAELVQAKHLLWLDMWWIERSSHSRRY